MQEQAAEGELSSSGSIIATDVASTHSYNFAEILSVEEDSEHEFKAIQQAGNPITIIAQYCERYINAFLNTEGGTIYFGVRDDGAVLGAPLNRKARDSLRLNVDGIVSSFRPQVDPFLVKLQFVKVVVSNELKIKMATKRRDKLPITTPMRGSKTRSKSVNEKDTGGEDHNDPVGLPLSAENLYVVEVVISKGRAPVYFCKSGGTVAYIRRAGSIHKMDFSMIEERKYMGRPNPVSLVTSELGARLTKTAVPQYVAQDFIGREEELDRIRTFAASSRSAVLTVILFGLPVVGKSALARRLAVEFSSTYPDRFVTIDLKDGVLKSYESIVDLKKNVIRTEYPTMLHLPTDEKEVDSLYDSCFAQKRNILLIENVGFAKQIQDLTPSSSKSCLVLVTSRKDLAMDSLDDVTLDSTLSIRLSALENRDAVKLLFVLVNNDETHRLTLEQAEEIVKLCGCLPLAIRMVGSSLRRKMNVKPEELIEKLRGDHERLKLVESSFITSLETYESSIRHNLLALSLFPGSFDGISAAALFGCGYEHAQDSLGVLLEYSLLDFDPLNNRYNMNDLLRLYCLKKAQELDGGKQMLLWQQQFLNHFKQLLETKTRELFGTDQPSSDAPPETQLEHDVKTAVLNFEEGEEPGGIKAKCQRWFATEKHNFQACLNFSRSVKDYKLVWAFAQAMTYFLSLPQNQGLVEGQEDQIAAKWQEIVEKEEPVDNKKNEKQETEKEKEQEKQTKGEPREDEGKEKEEKEKEGDTTKDEAGDDGCDGEVIVWKGLAM